MYNLNFGDHEAEFLLSLHCLGRAVQLLCNSGHVIATWCQLMINAYCMHLVFAGLCACYGESEIVFIINLCYEKE